MNSRMSFRKSDSHSQYTSVLYVKLTRTATWKSSPTLLASGASPCCRLPLEGAFPDPSLEEALEGGITYQGHSPCWLYRLN